MTLTEFNTTYPPHPPRKPSANGDEKRLLDAGDGVMQISGTPSGVAVQDRCVPQQHGDPGCHLWVFDANAIPFILELAPVASTLQSGRIKHTNLTGGSDASCGGELWIDPTDPNLIYLDGCSGRYGPSSPDQMENAVRVFEELGLSVMSFGWSDETNCPEGTLWPKAN